MKADVIRIANFSGFFGDRASAARELLDSAEIDVLTGDWLAELTMMILQRQQAKDPLRGYARSFLVQLEDVLGTCLDRGVRIVSNAGGLNPSACAAAVSELAGRLGLDVSVGHVEGDDLLSRSQELLARGELRDAVTGQALDLSGSDPIVANAYLGGWGITSCLQRGADVVVTGRVTDAALVVGAAKWAFDWDETDWDRLAGAVTAGHVIECGSQATGGNYAFFRDVTGLDLTGFPIAEIREDGSCVITKAPGSGGAVTTETVTAQLLYEVQEPLYLNPDVTTRLDTIVLNDDGVDRVRITGVQGEPPPRDLKVALAIAGGYRNEMTMVLTGGDIDAKAEIAERALWARIPGGREAFDEALVELHGRPVSDPASFGESQCFLRVAVRSVDEDLVGRKFSSALVETALSSYPGFFVTGAPQAASSYALYRPALVDAALMVASATVDGVSHHETPPGAQWGGEEIPADPDPDLRIRRQTTQARDAPATRAPLGRLLGARSGDKGGDANLGLWARDDEVFAWMDDFLSTDSLRRLLPAECENLAIDRYRLPNLRGLNFVIHRFLGDGVASCLRLDGQAKGLGEYVRSRWVDVPENLARNP